MSCLLLTYSTSRGEIRTPHPHPLPQSLLSHFSVGFPQEESGCTAFQGFGALSRKVPRLSAGEKGKVQSMFGGPGLAVNTSKSLVWRVLR